MNFTARLLALVAALFAASASAQDKVTISITTGPTGGIANILSKYVPGYAANAQSTAGSVANLQLMSQKKSELALSMADAAWDGYRAQGKFSGAAVPVRALMVVIWGALILPLRGVLATPALLPALVLVNHSVTTL